MDLWQLQQLNEDMRILDIQITALLDFIKDIEQETVAVAQLENRIKSASSLANASSGK